MPAHPSRGQTYFEAIKQAIAVQLGLIYVGPSSILTPGYDVVEYDDDGNETFNGPRQEQVVEGVEAMAGGSKTMAEQLIDKMSFDISPPGSLVAPDGPVTGSMPAASGWIDAELL
jgi:hypothetical protein